MVTKTALSSENIASEATYFAGIVKSIREALGDTQDEMARRIGRPYAVYRNWEQGVTPLKAADLGQILRSIPDPRMRAKYWLEINVAFSKLAGLPGKAAMDPRESERLRCLNDALIALEILNEAAASGSDAAQERLKNLADRLTRAAGDIKQLTEARKEWVNARKK